MNQAAATSKPFGFYKDSLLGALIVNSAQKGLGRGKFKNSLFRLWGNIKKQPMTDVRYHGLNLRLDPHSNTIDYKIMFSNKIREKKELKILEKHIHGNTVFLDIGANIGYYSLMAAKLGATKVLAIEPSPYIMHRLQDNIAINNFGDIIKHIPFGVGAKKETLELRISDNDLGGSSVVNDKLDGEAVKIDILPLNDILKAEKIDAVDIMKIDIEGMEDRALFPYFENLDKSHYPKIIIIEDNNEMWERNILQWLKDHGYEVMCETRSNVVLTLEA